MGAIQQNRREAKRYRLALPIEVGTATGRTCDVSESGLLFETHEVMRAGEDITFSLVLGEYDRMGPFRLQCSGTVVRVERRQRKTAVAVRIRSYGREAAPFQSL